MLYVHNDKDGIEYPAAPDGLFAVLSIKGTQHKVLRGDRIILENMGPEFQVGEQVVYDDIQMIGTADYTHLGRPSV